MVAAFDLRIGGLWARTFGYGVVEDLSITWVWSSTGSGLSDVSFRLAAPRGFNHPALRLRTLVQVIDAGGLARGSAEIVDINYDTLTVQCRGLFRRAERFNAEAATFGSLTTKPLTAVVNANTRGLGWGAPVDGFPDTSVSTTSESQLQLNTVAQVLNEYCTLNNKRWGLQNDDRPFIGDDPTVATIALRPGVPSMATAEDDYRTRWVVRYVAAVSGTPPQPSSWGVVQASTTVAPYGPREDYKDVSDIGQISSGTAQTYANQLLAATSARIVFSEAVELQPGDLTSIGGADLPVWDELIGKRVRHYGVIDSDGGFLGQTLEWVIGSVQYRQNQPLVIAPVDLAARTEPQLVAKSVRAEDDGNFS